MTIYQNTIAGSGFLQGPQGETGPAANTNITVYEYLATAGQTTFTGTDANSQTLTYTPSGIIVALNGSVLNEGIDFTATTGTSIILAQAAALDDELNIYTFPAFNVAGTYTQTQTNDLLDGKLNLTGGTITGSLAITGNTSISSNGYLQVPIGTTAQRPDTTTPGFIRYNTDLNSLESANGIAWANVGSGAASSGGGGGVSWQPVQNTNFIAVVDNGYAVNTQIANVTVTLPASPTVGSIITFVDYKSTFGSNNLILYPNGNKVNGNTSNVRLLTNSQGISLVYIDSTQGWINYSTGVYVGQYAVDYLIVAGGGGGGGQVGGGGGAGGLLSGASTLLTPGTSYTVTVGSGASGGTATVVGSTGGNSSFLGLTALGGGGGGSHQTNNASTPGGSGGGGAGGSGGSVSGASGTNGQGNSGGSGQYSPTHGGWSGGGGGGAGVSGSNGSGETGGIGGVGLVSSITGSSTYYSGGGGGCSSNSTNPAGGNGGGGSGWSTGTTTGVLNGTSNSGGGGGGVRDTYSGGYAGNGGSGVVIIRYQSTYQRATGGIVTQSGDYIVHRFTSSGTFVA